MPERPSVLARGAALRRRASRALRLLVVVGAAAAASACTEELEGGAGCPLLCPQQQAPFRDTVLEAVVFDTTLGPFPVLGVAPGALLASRGDTLETHVIVRFDALPDTYRPNGGTASEAITAVDSTVLRFFVDTLSWRATGAFTLEVFDVDTTAGDTVASVLQSLFRADRKVGEFAVGAVADSLRIPIDNDFLRQRIAQRSRVRLGVRIAPGANAQLRVGAILAGQPAPRLSFDPATDTTYLPLDVTPSATLPGAESDETLRLAYTVYALAVRGAEPLPAGTLRVGGFPAQRAYLRFAIPSVILDSSTVVRAELLLTQRPAGGADRGDSVAVQPLVGIARGAITDPYFATALAAAGNLAGVDSLRLVPRDSGERVVNIVNLVRGWSTLDADVSRFIALRIGSEGSQGAEVRFHDRTGPAALRPRLRVTYLPRTEFTLP